MSTTYNSPLITYNAFYYYLKDKNLAEKTISEHLKDITRFETWAKENNIPNITHLTYNELLSYVQYLKKASPPTGGRLEGLTVSTINNRINSIRKYFEHLKEEGTIENNPARRLRIKGAIKKAIIHPLSYTELEQLYHEYAQPQKQYREKNHRKVHERNTIILGLMVWQAVHSGELSKLEINHVKLNEGMIYIPATRRSNSRELKLESKQIILLHQYIQQLQTTKTHSTQQPITNNQQLFEYSSPNTIYYLVDELRGINPIIRNAQHIRASVILHWMKMYDKRTVQYMAGHKWISSTEQYEVQELTGLTDMLSKHHPFA